MVETTSKDIAINLQIKVVKVPVDEQLPVMVIWSRGSKQAKTKKRVLNEQVQSATFDEKFQINTQMELGEDGKPVKSKIVSQFLSQLTFLSIVNTHSRE